MDCKGELERQAIELYLRAWNTQEMIAEELGVSRTYITKIVTDSTDGKYDKTFEPFLYNIWNLHKAERRAGEILKDTERQKPGEYQRSHDITVAPKLSDIGISKNQSSRWQATADLPEDALPLLIPKVCFCYIEAPKNCIDDTNIDFSARAMIFDRVLKSLF